MSTNERAPYQIVGPATWELIRAAYLSGDSARVVSERFGVSQHAIRRRATLEHWTKRDYASALEARGVEPPAKREPLNIAERFAANYVPPPPPPEPQHPFADLIDALKQASSAVEERKAPPQEEALAEQEPSEAAALLERRALAQAGAALAKGRAADAKTFAALAEQMRKRVDQVGAERAEVAEAERLAQAEAERMVCDVFTKVAYVANAMVHAPSQAPAAFQGLVKLWREQNLGEGEADAEKAAAKLAASQAAWLDGRFEETLPDYVRAQMDEAWAKRRAELEGEAVVPGLWVGAAD